MPYSGNGAGELVSNRVKEQFKVWFGMGLWCVWACQSAGSLRPLPSGRRGAVPGEPAMAVVDFVGVEPAPGRPTQVQGTAYVGLAADATQVRWSGTGSDGRTQVLRLDLQSESTEWFTLEPLAPGSVAPSVPRVVLDPFEPERPSYAAVLPEGDLVVAVAQRVSRWSAKGVSRWSVELPTPLRGIRSFANSGWIVGWGEDGVLRWLDAQDGKVRLSLLWSQGGRDWVAWTAEGYYAASVGGARLIEFMFAVGPGGKRRLRLRGDQLQGQMHRPEYVAQAVGGLVAGGYAPAAPITVEALVDWVDQGPPPRVQLLEQRMVTRAGRPYLAVRYRVEDRGGGIGPVRLRVNGQRRAAQPQRGAAPSHAREAVYEQLILLSPGENLVELTAERADGGLRAQPITLRAAEPATPPAAGPIHLAVLAAPDSVAALRALQRAGSGPTPTRQLVSLVVQDANSARDRFGYLAGRIQPSDRLWLYVDGWLSRDADPNALTEEALLQGLARLPSRHILVLFTGCVTAGREREAREAIEASLARLQLESGHELRAAGAHCSGSAPTLTSAQREALLRRMLASVAPPIGELAEGRDGQGTGQQHPATFFFLLERPASQTRVGADRAEATHPGRGR